MHPSPNALALIKRFEGFAARVYACPGGYLTIGYGHVVHQPEAFAQGITEEEAARWLAADAAVAGQAVRRLIRVPLTQNQFDALVSFTFNLGAGRLQMSRLRMVINRGEYALAPHEFMRWVYGGGRILPGLVTRRRAEVVLYNSVG